MCVVKLTKGAVLSSWTIINKVRWINYCFELIRTTAALLTIFALCFAVSLKSPSNIAIVECNGAVCFAYLHVSVLKHLSYSASLLVNLLQRKKRTHMMEMDERIAF